jgi:biotin carboxyl carrier protein
MAKEMERVCRWQSIATWARVSASEPTAATARCLRAIREGKVESVDGNDVPVRAESICVHFDTPGAVSVTKAVRSALADYLGMCQPDGGGFMAMKAFPSPLPGLFHRAPAPDKPPFKSEGDAVAAGDTVGLIEVMKTFTPVLAEEGGRLVKFLVENEDTVMAGQPLYELDR